MDLTQTYASFHDTSHTLLADLHDPLRRKEAVEEISRIYWTPVYSYLRRLGMNRDQASETAQSFYVERIIAKQIFERFDPDRGRLRSYLVTTLKHYLIDEHRKQRAFGKKQPLSLDRLGSGLSETQINDAQAGEAACIFDQNWAVAQLEEAMRRCESHLRATCRARHWEAFLDRVYGPAVHGSVQTPLKKLAEDLGFAGAANVGAAVHAVNQMVLSYMQEVVAESTESARDAREEYCYILKMLNIQTVAKTD